MTGADQNDHKASEGNLVATIGSQTGLAGTLKGKAQRAILRLLAGGIAHPYVQQIRENLDEMDGRSKVNMMLAEEVGRQAITDPEMVERAKARFLGDVYRKQVNLEAVAVAASAQLGEDENQDEYDDPEPSNDWMNAFTRVAEDASSEQLRDRLASLLAGEIRKPGTFRRSTVHAVAEMDEETVQNLNKLMPFRSRNYIARGDDWQSGEYFQVALHLGDAGLINATTGLLSHKFSLNTAGFGIYVDDKYGLAFEGTPGTFVDIPIWLLSRSAQEIVKLLPPVDEKLRLKHLITVVNKSSLKRVILGRSRQVNDEEYSISKDEVVWGEPFAGSFIPTANFKFS